ncbi:MAG: polysaccharide biosynthesis protein [Clostridiaceae bacterium]|mgnify:FL=1|nr:polysaccharide biosynthesis protein [Clostridiaceae bacterium]
MFSGKTLLITGGTGSFGNAVLDRFLKTDIKEIRIFSRDEKKQDDMRRKYKNDKIKFYLGDIRDLGSLNFAMRGVDYVFHAAALKQVPTCEFFPIEAVKTNILGTNNVLDSAITHNVKKVICLSTDKAAYPINAMGMSKALMEKVFIAKARRIDENKTLICGTRYGNVLASRGSVVPLFVKQIKSGQPITITDPTITRFIMTLDEAINLVLYAFENGRSGDIMVLKSPACTIGDLAQALLEIFEAKNEIKYIGIRHGEKTFETLVTREEMARAEDMGTFYRIPMDSRDLNYEKYFSEGNVNIIKQNEYTSDNTTRLTIPQIKEKLLSLEYIRRELSKM